MNRKIAIAGTGYVGLSLAVLLAQKNQVTAVDIIPEKVEKINNKKSPIQDDYIEKYLAEKELNLVATTDGASAYKDAEFVIIAAPTNYDSKKNFFDTSAVEAVIELVMSVNPEAIMIIKSTIPVGYTESVRKKYNTDKIIFSPEFLRESKALYDNQKSLQDYFRKVQLRKISILYLWDLQKLRQLSFLLILIWHFEFPILMSWIPMQSPRD